MYFLLKVVIFFVSVMIAKRYYKRYKQGRTFNIVPGPSTIPILGNVIQLMSDEESLWNNLRFYSNKYYPIFRLWTPHWMVVSVRDADDLETILSSAKYNDKGAVYNLMMPWLGEGLLTSKETAMGVSLQDIDSKKAEEYIQSIKIFAEILAYKSVRPWLIPDCLFACFPIARAQNRALKIIHGFSTEIINAKKMEYENNSNCLDLDNPSAKKASMLDLLMVAYKKNEIDIQGIRDEVDTCIFEGYDTTATSLIYALMLLAEHEKVQERVREEIEQVLGESGGKIGMVELQKLNYLVLREKIDSSLPRCTPYLEATHEHYTIPAGVMVLIQIFDIHRDEKHWPDPLKFDPDRFLLENCQRRHPYSYIPFSAGFRNCIGKPLVNHF